MSQEIKRKNRQTVEEFHGERSRKLLKSSIEATAHMREYFKLQQQRIAQGEPTVLTWVGVPREILITMDILYTDIVHYGALCSAKQMSRYYLDILNTEGYFRDLCRYCTVSLGYAFDKKTDIAPYGGIPKPSAAVLIHVDDPALKISELYAREFDIPLYMINRTNYPGKIPVSERWWDDVRYSDAEIETQRIDLMVEEYQGMIRFLETITGKAFSETGLRTTLERRNQMNEWRWRATDLAAGTRPCPITAADSFANAAGTTWFPGSQWLVDHVRKYYEEIKGKVDKGEAALENERVRLYWPMYIGLWFSLGFYNAFEENYGAIFLPTPYQAWDGKGIRYDLTDPLRALASGAITFNLDRVSPTTSNRWFVELAKRYMADGSIFLMAESCKYNYATILFGKEALEKAGVPTIIINADMVDARDWDDTKMKSLVASFIETLMP